MEQNYQQQQTPLTPQSPPKNWLVESILVTLFCCMPLGIAGIVNAARVNSRFAEGDFNGALQSSKEAGKWTKISFWVGIVIWVIAIAILLIFGSLLLRAAKEGDVEWQ